MSAKGCRSVAVCPAMVAEATAFGTVEEAVAEVLEGSGMVAAVGSIRTRFDWVWVLDSLMVLINSLSISRTNDRGMGSKLVVVLVSRF